MLGDVDDHIKAIPLRFLLKLGHKKDLIALIVSKTDTDGLCSSVFIEVLCKTINDFPGNFKTVISAVTDQRVRQIAREGEKWRIGNNAVKRLFLYGRIEIAQTNADAILYVVHHGIDLCKMGASEKLLVSGDHGTSEYDEVNVMKTFATDRGIASENVFMDHAGFSTYESIYRAIAKIAHGLFESNESSIASDSS